MSGDDLTKRGIPVTDICVACNGHGLCFRETTPGLSEAWNCPVCNGRGYVEYEDSPADGPSEKGPAGT